VNKDLYGKQYKIPNNILNHLKKYSNNESIGNLLSNGNVSYSQLKKLKNRMENGEKKELGEDQFYNWVNQTLNSDRGSLETSKQIKSDTGMQNQFIRPHEKNGFSNHNKTNADVQITEALKRINQIMSKII
jgi:hypothetical protein